MLAQPCSVCPPGIMARPPQPLETFRLPSGTTVHACRVCDGPLVDDLGTRATRTS